MTSHLLLLLVLVLVLLSHLFLFHLSSIHHVNKVLGCEAQELGPRDVLRRIGVGDGVVVRGRGLRVVRGRALRGVGPCGGHGHTDGVVVRGRGLRVVRGRGLVVRSVPAFFVLVVRGRGLCVVVVFALRGVVFAAQQRPQHTNAFIADCFIHGTWDWC